MRYQWQGTLDETKFQDNLNHHIYIGQIRVKNLERRAYSSRFVVEKDSDHKELPNSPECQEYILDMSQRVTCRICREGDDLVQPCLCRGSVGYVHIECLKMWVFSSSNHNLRKYYCELCHCPYNPSVRNLLKDCETTNAVDIHIQGYSCRRIRRFSCTPAQLSALIVSCAVAIVTAVLLTLVLTNANKS